MQITQVSVSWKETHSLPGYNNISPSLSLSATVEQGESPDYVKAILLQQCKEFCHSEIDNALEAEGQSPVYDTFSPRYLLYQHHCSENMPVIIVPARTPGEEPNGWSMVYYLTNSDTRIKVTGVRLEAARRLARRVNASEIIEALDLDDLNKLETIAPSIREVVKGNGRERVKQYGNTVTPPAMAMLMERFMATFE